MGARVQEAFAYFTQGYAINLQEKLSASLYPCKNAGEVVVQNIQFISLCEHHLLPMVGKCDVAYWPHDQVLGLSRLSEMVQTLSLKLQLQERLTHEIASLLQQVTQAQGVAVRMRASHTCMALQGLDKLGQTVLTSCFLGKPCSFPEEV